MQPDSRQCATAIEHIGAECCHPWPKVDVALAGAWHMECIFLLVSPVRKGARMTRAARQIDVQEVPDEALMARYAAGDPDAFEQLLQRLLCTVRPVLLRDASIPPADRAIAFDLVDGARFAG